MALIIRSKDRFETYNGCSVLVSGNWSSCPENPSSGWVRAATVLFLNGDSNISLPV
jgi:hypothetical protein